MAKLSFLDNAIDLTPVDGEILSGSSGGTLVTVPNIPSGAIMVIIREVVTAKKLDGFVGYGTGGAGAKQYHFVARAQVVSATLTAPYAEQTCFVKLVNDKIYRQHSAYGGTLKHWSKIIGWGFPDNDQDISELNGRVSALEAWQASIKSFLTSVKNIWNSYVQ